MKGKNTRIETVPDLCNNGEAHRFTVIERVSSEGVMAKCAACGKETTLREKQDFADFDRDESHFYTLDNDGNAVITSYNCSATKVYFPGTIDGHEVVAIDLDENMEWPLDEDKNLNIGGSITDVSIAPGIERIEPRAFCKWVSLREVYLMEGLRSVGDSALTRTSMQQVYLPDGLERLGSGVFGRSSAVFVSIPASVKEIDEPETLAELNDNETAFFVSEDNPNYSSANGSLCSKDQKTVYLEYKNR